MKKNVLLALAMALITPLSQAEINNEAGNLSQQVTNNTITSLTVTGELDARDFRFIADSLNNLETVDLSQATIVAYYNDEPLFGTKQDYPAGYLPATTFFGKPIVSIVLPQSIENIGEAAFASCQNLTNIEFPSTLTTIGDYAFSASGLTEVTLPESITTLGICVFSHCGNLTQAIIGTTTTGNGTFLADTLLSQVNMAAAVRFIGDNAFTGCKALNAIEIEQPSQLSAIGIKAFMESGLQELNLSELDSIGAFAFAKSAIGAANYPAAITAVEPGTFFYAPQLTTFDAAVNQIGDYAFAGSNNLDAMPLPQGVETIGDYAFYNMDNITQFTVPQSATYIGSYAMAGMTALETIEGEPTIVPQLGDKVWAGVDQAHVTLFVDQSVVEDYKAAFQWQEFLVKSHFLLGDVNADGIVNVADITTLVNHLLDRYVPIFIFEAGDLDGNGIITITDVTLLSTLILSSNNSPVAHFMPITTSDITLTDITAQNQSLTTQLTLSNTQQYTAIQADITMPQGVTINDITTGQRANKHQLDWKQIDENTYRVVLASRGNQAFNGNNGALLNITIDPQNNISDDSEIAITNIVLATTDNEAHQALNHITRIATPTGVSNAKVTTDKVYAQRLCINIETEQNGIAQIITTNGQMREIQLTSGVNSIDVPQGIYLVRLNGKTHKLLVK